MDKNPGGKAPWYHVPANSFVSVEHPCLVKNVDKAIDMLGGSKSISDALQNSDERSLSLSFNPHDPTTRTIMSLNNKTDNVLLKITVPKRTGRRRKRGSDQPFTFDPDVLTAPKDAEHLIQALVTNPEASKIEPLGIIENTHVWRSLPDFVYSTKGSAFLKDVQSQLLTQNYPSMKNWSMPKTYGLTNTEVFPPPVLSNVTIPQNYTYRQNTAIKPVTDAVTGTKRLSTMATNHQVHTYQCKEFDNVYPSVPAETCPPLSEQPIEVQELYPIILELFVHRPIWTRRALLNQLPDKTNLFFARQAISYVAFALRAGPWRDALCKLGVDPRTDPKYRKYQTVLLQLMSKDKNKENTRDEFARTWTASTDKQSHIFMGQQKVSSDGKVWQLCDLEDMQLKALVDISDEYIRDECERKYFGWYWNGTIAKIRITLKAKVDALMSGTPLDDSALTRFLAMPDNASDMPDKPPGNISDDPVTAKYYFPKDTSKFELDLASAYRGLCRTVEGKVPRSTRSSTKVGAFSRITGNTSVESTPIRIEDSQILESGSKGSSSRQASSEEVDEVMAAAFKEPNENDDDEAFISQDGPVTTAEKTNNGEDVEMVDVQ